MGNIITNKGRIAMLVAGLAVATLALATIADAHPHKKHKIEIETKGAFLGVSMQQLTEELREGLNSKVKDGGVLISNVVEDSPAAKAGLEEGDIVVEFDGKKVDSPDALRALIAEKEIGDEVKMKVLRDGKSKKFDVTLGDWEDFSPMAMWSDGDRFEIAVPRGDEIRAMLTNLGGPRLGVRVHEMDEDLSSYFGVDKGEGVLVLGVEEETTAEDAGIKSGDVIIGVGEDKVSDVGDIREALKDLEKGDKVSITVMRKNKKVELEGELKSSGLAWTRSVGDYFHYPHTPRMMIHDDRDLRQELDELRKELEELKQELKKS